MNIPFYKHDLCELEIQEVLAALKSGWINTGERTAAFEDELKKFTAAGHVLAVNSATAGLFLSLLVFGIGAGDEVITTPYTFSATAAAILQTGATPVFADIGDDFLIDPASVMKKISKKTKAILPVDFGGKPADYEEIYKKLSHLVRSGKMPFSPNRRNPYQCQLNRPLVLADASHSFGSRTKHFSAGTLADLSVFSFHAVKNITTSDGGSILCPAEKPTWVDNDLNYLSLFEELRRRSLHGMSMNARERLKSADWRYDVLELGYKFNMTDLEAALGSAQLKRWPDFFQKRKHLVGAYELVLKHPRIKIWPQRAQDVRFSHHLFPIRIEGIDEQQRDALIMNMQEEGICCNVHYRPLPMLSFYKNLGYAIEDTPQARRLYSQEITLPLYTQMTDADVERVGDTLKKLI